MPKPDYRYSASVVVACEGPGPGTTRNGRFGTRRSRDGADLVNVAADADFWHENFVRNDPLGESPVSYNVLLVNPTRDEVRSALTGAGAALAPYDGEPHWNGGEVNFAFAGHGTADGGLVVADGELDGGDIAKAILDGGAATTGRRRVAAVFDSCHSAVTLAQILLHDRHAVDFLLIDGFAACLHDELAWELDALGHGALTYSMKHRGNAHVGPAELASAIDRGEDAVIRSALQAFTPNPVTYLTEGDQHSIDAINGHAVDVLGAGGVDVLEDVPLSEFLDALADARDASYCGLLDLPRAGAASP